MPIDDEFTPRKAVKSQVKLKLAVDGPSGSGKTFSGLALACHLANLIAEAAGKPGQGRVLGIDTENDSMALYADEFTFEHISFRSPFTSQRYIRAMTQGVAGGFDVMFVDSLSHQWEGDGGTLSRKMDLDAKGGNSFTNWAQLSPEHTRFVEFLKQLPIHTICTMRSKTEYVLETKTNAQGKSVQTPRKIGLAPVQREGIDYEFSVVFDLSIEHLGTAVKDRTRINGESLFAGEAVDLADPSTAAKLWSWLNSGAPIAEVYLGEKERKEIGAALRHNNVALDDLMIWIQQTMGFKATKDIPVARMYEIMTWIQTPREVTQEEKIARQTMDAWKWTPEQKATLIQKHSRNWSEINEELDWIETQKAAKDTIPTEYTFEAPNLTCYVLDVNKKIDGTRQHVVVQLAATVEGKNVATCWHKSLADILMSAVGQQCDFAVSINSKGYITIDDVLRVGPDHYEGGKWVQVAGDQEGEA